MDLQAAVKESLQLLYDDYLTSPGSLSYIGEIAEKHEIGKHQLGKYMQEEGYIKDQAFLPTDFRCRITLIGINEIDPNYIPDMESKIISTLGTLGGRQDAFEVLDLEPKDDVRIRDIVSYLENKRMLENTMYGPQQIIIQLTLRGQQYYEDNKPNWL